MRLRYSFDLFEYILCPPVIFLLETKAPVYKHRNYYAKVNKFHKCLSQCKPPLAGRYSELSQILCLFLSQGFIVNIDILE